MHILSLINYKGGVGKTVLTANVAAELAFTFGLKVLLVDLDPQASLTFACIPVETWRALEARRTIKTWYDSFIDAGIDVSINNLIHAPRHLRFARGHVDLIPSHLGLINVDLELATKLSGASRRQQATNYRARSERLATIRSWSGYGFLCQRQPARCPIR